MKKEKLKRIARRITAFAAAVAMTASITFSGGTFGGFGLTASAETVGAFEVTGGTPDIDYTYSEGLLTVIKNGANLTIKNTDPNTKTEDHILIDDGVSASITLAGVNIYNANSSFQIYENSTGNVTVTLKDDTINNIYCKKQAGLDKSGDSEDVGTLTIQCEKSNITGHTCDEHCGKLQFSGAYNNASIGGAPYKNTKNITINGGNIIASSVDAAAIGGGYSGSASRIKIHGGNIKSTTSGGGAGIGGGLRGGAVSDIEITDGNIIASSGETGAGIGGSQDKSVSNIKITGGTINASSKGNGAGIGGGAYGIVNNITISGGVISADSYGGAGIGTGSGCAATNIRITGDAVVTAHSVTGAGIGRGNSTAPMSTNIVITAKSVKSTSDAGVTDTTATDESGNGVYLLRTDLNKNNETVYIDSHPYPINQHTDTDLRLYLYFTSDSDHTVKIGETGEEKNYIYNDTVKQFVKEIPDPLLEITSSDSSAAPVKGYDYSYDGSEIHILTSKKMTISNFDISEASPDYIIIDSGVAADITLAGVNIIPTAVPPIKIADDSSADVKISLADDTVNTLVGNISSAALQKNGGSGTLTITCQHSGEPGHICSEHCGTLSAKTYMQSGSILYSGTAAIGACDVNAATNITISGGNIIAEACVGAAIGGSSKATVDNDPVCKNINITGGNITANSTHGAGIGSGKEGKGQDITISGGVINASSIGKVLLRESFSGLKISGGTITTSKIYLDSDLQIKGGSVKASSISGAAPTDGTGNVYLLKISNPNSEAVYIDGELYTPVNHTALDSSDTNLYAYLTGEEHTVTIGTGESAVTTEYIYDSRFLAVPKASDFTFTAPGAPIEYDGSEKEATVRGASGTGAVTVKYYLVGDGGSETELINGKPVNVGTYKVKIDVEKGTSYTAAQDLSADDWTFEITPGTPTAADFDFAEPSELVYDGGEKTAAVTEKDSIIGMGTITVNYYDADDNKLSSAPIASGTYTVKIDVTAGTNYKAVTDLTAETWTFTIGKATPDVLAPTATAITYGEALSASTLSDTNWSWVDKTVIPTIQNSGYPAKITVDDSNYDYTSIDDYDSAAHTVTRTIAVPVNKATPTITVIASPTSDIAGKTITVTASAKNPNNDEFDDVPTPVFTYKVGESGTETAFTGSFVIPEGTPIGTVITITAKTSENGNYTEGTGTAMVTVTDCEHTDVAEWEKDSTGHWHICNYCGAVVDKAEHTYGSWKITVPATADANGKKERSCTVCGYVQEGTVIYGGDESTGDMENATDPENNALHADLELSDEEIISKIPLTPEELEAIENGADLEVYMVVIDYSGNVPAEDKALAESVLTGDMQIGMYIDVSLFVKVGDNDPRAVTNTNGNLKITFEMPEKLINTDKNVTREYSIIRVHSGEAAILDCAYDNATGKGSFKTDKFSSYAIAYKDTKNVAEVTPAEEAAEEVEKILDDFTPDNDTTAEDILEAIESVVDEDVTVEITNIEIIPATEDSEGSITVTITITDDEGNTETIETVIVIDKIPDPEPEPEPEPEKTVYYPVITSGNVVADKSYAAAGQTVNVKASFGYDIIVTAENGRQIAKMTEKGSFTMPASKVYVTAVQNETFALMANAWNQSYVYSYDADMNKIKVNSTKKRGVIVIDLGEEYAGRTFTIYSGRKSTKVKVAEGVLDENGKFVFEVPDGKNYTLVVEN